MTRWLWLVVPGGSAILVGYALYRLWKRSRTPFIDIELQKLIKPPVQKFTGHDEGLARLTRQRREAADKIRIRAAHVETGSKVADVLRIVRR